MNMIDQDALSVFQKSWWLDAVAPGQWRYLTVERDRRCIALMPLVSRDRYGVRAFDMPKLTYTLGPRILLQEKKTQKNNANQVTLLRELVDQLPEFDFFRQNFDSQADLPLPFIWNDFHIRNIYTYVIPDLTDEARVWDNYASSLRSQIRKGQAALRVEERADPELMWGLLERTYGRHGQKPPYGKPLYMRLERACRDNNSGLTLFAADADGRTYSALWVVWDRESAYYLVSGTDPDLRGGAGVSLLMHEAITRLAPHTRRFDFMGCMHKSFEPFKRNFGGVAVANIQVTKFAGKLAMLNRMKVNKYKAYKEEAD